MLNITKIAASSYTAGLGQLPSGSAAANVAGQTVPASTTVTLATLSIAIPNKTQAIASLRLNYNGIAGNNVPSSSNWYLVPQDLTILDAGNRPGTLTARYSRSNAQINITIQSRAGSGGLVLSAFTASVVADFYQMPF